MDQSNEFRGAIMLYRCLTCVFLVVVSSRFAQAASATQPASAEAPVVLVLPFTGPGPQQYQWIGRGVQQDLLADLTPHVRGSIAAPADASAASEAPPALQSARDRHASVVVFGSVQAIGDQLRLTGQVVDVASGKALAGLKATGSVETVFHLEDALAAQVIRAIPERLLTRQSLSMLRRDATPPTFAPGPLGGSAYAGSPTVAISPMQPLDVQLNVSMPNMLTSPYGYWPGYWPARGPAPRAYPPSYYHPYLSSLYSHDVFFFVSGRHR